MKMLAYVLGSALFSLGDLISKSLMDLCPTLFYPVYNKLMGWSFSLDEKYNLGLWEEHND